MRANPFRFEQLYLSLLPSGQRKQTRDSWHTVERDIGAFLHGQIIYGLVVALLLGLGYWLLGTPFPAFLTLIGALACLLPVVGPALVLIPVLVVGLLTSVQLGLLMTLYALVVLIALAVWVKPRMFNHKWNNPLLTLVLLLLMADAFGLAGVILALPLSVAYQIIRSRLGRRRTLSGASAQVSDLKERHARVWDTIKAMDWPPLALVASSMERLDQLIAKAEPILQAGQPISRPPA